MDNLINLLLAWGTPLVLGYGIIVMFGIVGAILSHRDQLYKAKYMDSLRQKLRADASPNRPPK